MNKSMLGGVLVGVVSALTLSAVASGNLLQRQPDSAEVLAVKPVTRTVKTPEQVCGQVSVTHRRPVQDEHKLAGTIIGATLGGVLGHQIGGGNGKKLATAAGAVAGGYAGNQVQGNMQRADTYTSNERRCRTVQKEREESLGYDVTYRLSGKEGVVRMPHQPGNTIPVRDGRLVLDQEPLANPG
ncbi:glycine zipper 2TM domain-containing protein [Aeromonas simiae]|uniref:glycine zipper 2TM domain-containing protein n=1 Tax=Aeromonas simiae TaxID=218936 RepID=UPI00266B852D|nr:glycine zipper 2TM domain-containing protein [Aeromonas simiae]MDO2947744.1 glycine zipper 2TM domain-containing protein [Aeromonas simiae]MDO2952364.1 glycine zipper 2TM domain-containing protein [Aeromonas simiae]MDO2954959.1 glycine zipper 2TM domain-containing protein [Aeromonas simiae]